MRSWVRRWLTAALVVQPAAGLAVPLDAMASEAARGALFLLASPPAWAAIAATLAASYRGAPWPVLAAAMAAGAASAAWLPAGWVAGALPAVALLGAFGAARWKAQAAPAPAAAVLLAAAGGVATAFAAEFHWASPVEAAAGAAVLLATGAATFGLAQWLERKPRPRPAVRLGVAVIGVWSFVFAVLLFLLERSRGS